MAIASCSAEHHSSVRVPEADVKVDRASDESIVVILRVDES